MAKGFKAYKACPNKGSKQAHPWQTKLRNPYHKKDNTIMKAKPERTPPKAQHGAILAQGLGYWAHSCLGTRSKYKWHLQHFKHVS